MRLRHFETLRPVCPVCRPGRAEGAPLRIAHVAREEGGVILQAILHCSNLQCQREYPVLDGIPYLLGNLRQFVNDSAQRMLSRDDLDPLLESLIGDCLGPGSDFDASRQQVSAYAEEHYGDKDATVQAEAWEREGQGSLLAALEAGLELAGGLPAGPVLDVGCGPGRSTFELAERTGELVLGVDLHVPMLRLAARVLREGRIAYDRRRVGLVYHRREFPARFAASEQVDFWACDATALPFPEHTFSAGVALNLLDCVYAPLAFLSSLASTIAPGGSAVLTSPYDWSVGVTPVEGWIGGHSQRGPQAGSSEAALRSLLAPSADGTGGDRPALTLVAERDDLSWRVRLHDRAVMHYRLHLVVARREPADRALPHEVPRPLPA